MTFKITALLKLQLVAVKEISGLTTVFSDMAEAQVVSRMDMPRPGQECNF